MPNIGPLELGIVLVIALIILGPKKLPDMGRSLGRGMREFKSAVTGDHDDDRKPELAEAEADEADGKAGDDEHDEQPAERERPVVAA
jgi:sec-independent protein translocase protein TatA